MSPHFSSASFVLHASLLAAKTTTKSTSSSFGFIFIIVIFAGAYFLLIRPQRQRARKVQQTQQAIEIGDEVMLTSGIIGRITWLEGDRARLQIAPNTEIEVLRAAIGRTVPAPVADEDIAPQEDDSHYGDNTWSETDEAARREDSLRPHDGPPLLSPEATPTPGSEPDENPGEDEASS